MSDRFSHRMMMPLFTLSFVLFDPVNREEFPRIGPEIMSVSHPVPGDALTLKSPVDLLRYSDTLNQPALLPERIEENHG
jgi:hypothetical protein